MVFVTESRDGAGCTPPDFGRGVVSKEEAPHALGCDGFRDGEVCAPEFAVARDCDGLGAV